MAGRLRRIKPGVVNILPAAKYGDAAFRMPPKPSLLPPPPADWLLNRNSSMCSDLMAASENLRILLRIQV